MSDQRPGMFVPALIGGALAGVLSGIPIVNCLCCLWIIGGAILASYLLCKDSSVSLSAGDGAIVGALAGIIAAVVDTIISIPFEALNSRFFQRIVETLREYAEDMPYDWETWIDKSNIGTTTTMMFLGLLFSVVVFTIFGVLGGIIGISIFGKKISKKSQEVIDVSKDANNR